MRISDWSSDVCSSDLRIAACLRDALRSFVDAEIAPDAMARAVVEIEPRLPQGVARQRVALGAGRPLRKTRRCDRDMADRKSVVQGKSVAVSVYLGGRGLLTKKNSNMETRRASN